MKRAKLINPIFNYIFFFLVVGCSLKHQVLKEPNEITGAFGFHFGEKIQSYKIKSEDNEVMVVEPTVIRRPNPVIERYALKLDKENKSLLEINGLNHSLQQRKCLQVKERLVENLKEMHEFEKTEFLEDLELRPKKSLFYGESADKSGVVVGCLMNVGFLYSNSDTLLMIRYFAPSAKTSMQLLSQ